MSDQNRNDGTKAPDATPGAIKADPIYHVDDRGGLSSVGTTSTTDPHQPSALGGEVAARSGSTEVAEGEDDAGAGRMGKDKRAGHGPGFGGSSGA